MNEPKQKSLLSDLLDVDRIDETHFIGHRLEGDRGRIFGGEVLAQALMAASNTVAPDKQVHSAHNYFMRPGDSALPIHYEVFADLDGRSFSNRRVVARQNDKPIFSLTASFQAPEPGLAHQQPMPEKRGPEGLPNERELAQAHADQLPEKLHPMLSRERPFEVRPVNGEANFLTVEPTDQQSMWFRSRESIGNNAPLQRATLAYASDLSLLSTCMRPHGVTWRDPQIRSASIDHAIWFHATEIRTEDWMLYVMDSPWSGASRGLNRGSIYTQDGQLIASVAQEGLIRMVE
ncbi:acyl-CoA thioesterase II [Halopseudomonas nanhaiensis]|uniref:acyl-CoA thioesterase n=1 Tax=Halopseudomonas nanhaiensis TaxID=2830842 RepID=UPI001CBDE85D|nr:acyl-CoA thioesterase II [Halopseudomonas nanhaiensis]UAW99585.1 acyl-CoA thioesterase II [Halopseudomonas nanhaiensis]